MRRRAAPRAALLRSRPLAALALILAAASLPAGVAEAPEPTVTDVNPMNGPTKGGTIVTIGGANFGTGDTSVQPQVSVASAADTCIGGDAADCS